MKKILHVHFLEMSPSYYSVLPIFADLNKSFLSSAFGLFLVSVDHVQNGNKVELIVALAINFVLFCDGKSFLITEIPLQKVRFFPKMIPSLELPAK